MSDTRDEVLRKIRLALGQSRARVAVRRGSDEGRSQFRAPAAERLVLLERFIAHAAEAGASIQRLQSLSAVPASVAERVAPLQTIRCSSDPELSRLQWCAAGLKIAHSVEALAESGPVVSGCLAAVAETGSIVLSSGTANTPLCNLTAGEHIVVVRADRILARLEDAWLSTEDVVHRSRSTVFVTGASRTGDIEQKIEIGVHGALSLHLLLVCSLR